MRGNAAGKTEESNMKSHIRTAILSAVLAVALLLTLPALGTVSAAAESTLTLTEPTFTDADRAWYGDGSAAEFTISTRGELAYLMELGKGDKPVTFYRKTIRIGADIIWNDGEATDAGMTAGEDGVIYRWTPYASAAKGDSGNFTTKWFRGTIDGQGHSISGLCMSGENYQAFLCGGAGATVKNLKLDNLYVEALGTGNVHSAGLIARTTYTTSITNVHISGIFRASGNGMGGMIGVQTSYNAIGLNLKNCTVSGKIIGTGESYGGFIGANSLAPTMFDTCVSYMDVEGALALGGFVGRLCATTSFTDCAYIGTVTCPASAKSKTGAFGYLTRESYQFAADSLKTNLAESNGVAAVTLTDSYFQGGTPCPFAFSVNTNRQWFRVSATYAGEESKTFGYDSDSFSTTSPKANADALTALCKSLALYSGDTDRIEVGYAQMTKPADGKYDLRLLATLNLEGIAQESVRKVGFEIRNLTMPDASQTVSCGSVWQSITSDFGLTTVTAEELGADYLAAVVIRNLSVGKQGSLLIRPFLQVEDAMHYGAWRAVTVCDGALCNVGGTAAAALFPAQN